MYSRSDFPSTLWEYLAGVEKMTSRLNSAWRLTMARENGEPNCSKFRHGSIGGYRLTAITRGCRGGFANPPLRVTHYICVTQYPGDLNHAQISEKWSLKYVNDDPDDPIWQKGYTLRFMKEAEERSRTRLLVQNRLGFFWPERSLTDISASEGDLSYGQQ